jgi:hypothetical protein
VIIFNAGNNRRIVIQRLYVFVPIAVPFNTAFKLCILVVDQPAQPIHAVDLVNAPSATVEAAM